MTGDQITPGIEHAYMQLAAILRKRITGGIYGKGMPLPARDRLATEFEVSVDTVNKAIGVLRAEGLVVTVPGRGIYVV